jgi:hypothetical protein
MSSRRTCWSASRPTVDLLPWADPYIAQLFAEAHLTSVPVCRRADEGDDAWESGEGDEDSLETAPIGAPASVRGRRRLPAARLHRTAIAHALAAC